MRYPATEKLEIIRIVEQSHLPAKHTLDQLGIARRTFYRWYDRFLEGGPEALAYRPSAPSRVWNRIPPAIHDQIIELALEQSELSPRELAVRFTDEKRYFVSEATVCRLLKAHFLIRAFLAEGVDEFLAHITTIEAALGLRAYYQKSSRVAPDRHKGMRATNRMRGRVAGLLGDRSHADQYEQLFDIRSAFLHGRAMTDISTQELVMARSLARQVVEALTLSTQSGQIPSRKDFLDSLLDKGAPLI